MSDQNTQAPFVREARYVVFKIKDIDSYLTEGEKNSLMCIGEEIEWGRKENGRDQFNAVVIEQDWPEFDVVWEMLEARMTGGQNTASVYAAAPDLLQALRKMVSAQHAGPITDEMLAAWKQGKAAIAKATGGDTAPAPYEHADSEGGEL